MGSHPRRWLVGGLLCLASCTPSPTPDPTDSGVTGSEAWPERPERAVDAGRVTLKRLTNVEYDNTVRDLLGTELRPSTAFPPDALAHGWDHMAAAQTVSSLHIDMYLQAAEALVQAELGSPIVPDQLWAFEGEDDFEATTGGVTGTYYNLWSNGTAETTVTVPSTGTYTLTAGLAATQGGPDLARAALLVDGVEVTQVDVTGDRETNPYATDIELTAGRHTLGVAFLNDYYEPEVADRNLLLDWVELSGPTGVSAEPTEARTRYYTCEPPGTEAGDRACALEVAENLASRAWRRPVDDEGRAWLEGLYDATSASEADWEARTHAVLTGVLVSPRFLFRLELDPDPTAETSRPLDGYEMASRLSYFLWRTTPDEELLALAAEDELQDDAVLQAQVERMLADPRADTVVTEYAGQWLAIRAIDDVEPDYALFPGFDDELRVSMRGEMEAFAGDILLADRSMLELLTAEQTWVDRRLAEHYGVAPPSRDGFVKVDVSGHPRPGLFGKAGLLTALSFPKRTSPVKRGQWVMANLLCEAPPPAPAAVEGLDEEGTEGLTLREKMQKHREDPACATCHRVMDPIGFSMENYDAVGAWRTEDIEGYPIDASGSWPGGPSFADASELASALARDPRVPDCMAQTTFAYALGRPATIEDRPYLEGVQERFAQRGYRFQSLATAIVLSEPFRTKRGEAP